GMMSVEAAKARPLAMAMSGPAAGVAAAAHTARALGIGRALAFDMGGTTTDVCLVADGVPETAGQRKLGDYPVRLPMLAVESIGAGGGSIARAEAGAFKVGPRSAGAVPGPACYGLGGTEPDVCLVADGVPETAGQRKLGDYPVRLPMLAVESIGAGGGSIARAEAGAFKVGPRSAGAVPGPACYGLGGTEPTVTDANLVLGRLDPHRVYGRSIRLDPGRAHAALEALGRRFGLSVIAAAQGVVDVADASMLRALRLVSVQRGYDLREFALIAYGGAGPLHAGALARQAGMSRVIVPAHSGAFSALGCLVSPVRYDAVQTHRAKLEGWDAKVVADRFRALEQQCLRPLAGEGHAARSVLVGRSLDLRYTGQNYEIDVPYEEGDVAALRLAFERRHRQLYGYATGESVECVNLRVMARIEPDAALAPVAAVSGAGAPLASPRAFFPETGEVSTPRHDRGALAVGQAVAGPAVIEDEWSTTVVYPGQRCVADSLGNLVIETGR
ncbi:MAG: hydantoinase, partial [Candidatus Rokuibacteriota bacterium]